MGWVSVKGHFYYRRSKRYGNRVVTEYVGGGYVGAVVAIRDREARDAAKKSRERDRATRDAEAHTCDEFFEFDDVLANVVAALAHRQGWHRHHRQWRRKRGADVTIAEQALKILNRMDNTVKPLLAPDMHGVPEADKALLEKAATGDAASLAAAEPYFTDTARLRRWGDPMHAARHWLVYQAGGDNALVKSATHRYANELRDGLGWHAADALQRLAIVRVVNNWLAVGVLEAKANGYGPNLPARGPIEKALTLAERRLMQAVRMLAVLRGVKPAEVLAKVQTAAIVS